MSVQLGIFGVLLASVFWGSNCVVCRGYDLPDDGMHFVLLMATGILFVGILSLFTAPQENGDFEVVFSPEGLAGGIVWACGNFLTVPIIRNCGLGLGFATWSGVNLVVAFVVGTLGFGHMLPGEALERPHFGLVGILLAIIALVLFANVKPAMETTTSNNEGRPTIGLDEQDLLDRPFLDPEEYTGDSEEMELDEDEPSHQEETNVHHSSGANKVLGISFAMVAGVLYGFQFVPLTIWHNKVVKQGHIFDQDIPSEFKLAMRFFFSQFAGTFLASFVAFFLYCMLHGKPKLVPPAAVLPSIISGSIWAIGCAGGMLATAGLGNAIGFPLLLNGAFIVNSCWSIFYFGEIKGRRNLQLFSCAFFLCLCSSIFISLSKG